MAYAAPTSIGGGDTADGLAVQLFDLALKASAYRNTANAQDGDATALAALKAAIASYTNGTF